VSLSSRPRCLPGIAFLSGGQSPEDGPSDGACNRWPRHGEGEMMVMKDGQIMPMAKEMMMPNGSKVMQDGTVMMKNGKQMKMKDGDMMKMDGSMMTMKDGMMMKMSGMK